MPLPYKTTVTTAASTYDLTVLETVKEELSITSSATDDLLSRLISEQSAVAAAYCGRQFAQETIVDTFRVFCGPCQPLVLSRSPIDSITTIVEAGTTLAADDFEYDSDSGFVWRLSGDDRSTWADGKTEVTFIAGYELLAELPRDVERAVLQLIKLSYFGRTRDPRAKSETVEGIGSIDFWVGNVPGKSGLPADVTELLNPYRMAHFVL